MCRQDLPINKRSVILKEVKRCSRLKEAARLAVASRASSPAHAEGLMLHLLVVDILLRLSIFNRDRPRLSLELIPLIIRKPATKGPLSRAETERP
jgi:hypothetical protein